MSESQLAPKDLGILPEQLPNLDWIPDNLECEPTTTGITQTRKIAIATAKRAGVELSQTGQVFYAMWKDLSVSDPEQIYLERDLTHHGAKSKLRETLSQVSQMDTAPKIIKDSFKKRN